MKVYKSFASKEVRNSYICKSEITKDLLRDLNISDSVTINYAKNVFDDLVDEDCYIVVPVGSIHDKSRRKHVKFVSKNVFYKALIKGHCR